MNVDEFAIPLTLDGIKEEVEKACHVNCIETKSRQRKYTNSRAVYAVVVRTLINAGVLNATYTQVADILGVTHASVIHLEKNVFPALTSEYKFVADVLIQKYISSEAQMSAMIDILEKQLTRVLADNSYWMSALKGLHPDDYADVRERLVNMVKVKIALRKNADLQTQNA